MAIYWPTPGFKRRMFKLCVITRWDFNFCVGSSPLQGHANVIQRSVHMILKKSEQTCQVWALSGKNLLGNSTCFCLFFCASDPLWPWNKIKVKGWGSSSFGRAVDRHTADAGSIPQWNKGFFPQSQLSVQTLLWCLYTPVCNRMHLHLCAH